MGKIGEFDPSHETWAKYAECLELHSITNGIEDTLKHWTLNFFTSFFGQRTWKPLYYVVHFGSLRHMRACAYAAPPVQSPADVITLTSIGRNGRYSFIKNEWLEIGAPRETDSRYIQCSLLVCRRCCWWQVNPRLEVSKFMVKMWSMFCVGWDFLWFVNGTTWKLNYYNYDAYCAGGTDDYLSIYVHWPPGTFICDVYSLQHRQLCRHE